MSFQYRFRQIKKFPDWVFAPLVWLLYLYKLILRKRIVDPYDHLGKKNPPGVTVTWHNRLMFFAVMFPKWQRKHTLAVISASRDGQYVVDIVKQMGIGALRGSSSRKGFHALHGAFNAVREGKYVSFTPDGPRGPRYHMSPGPIHLASRTGVPVIPISVNYSAFWSLKSWDGFQIPKPWSRVTLVLGEPMRIPPELSPEELEKWRLAVQSELNRISEVKE